MAQVGAARTSVAKPPRRLETVDSDAVGEPDPGARLARLDRLIELGEESVRWQQQLSDLLRTPVPDHQQIALHREMNVLLRVLGQGRES
jgi:hypothetical protein